MKARILIHSKVISKKTRFLKFHKSNRYKKIIFNPILSVLIIILTSLEIFLKKSKISKKSLNLLTNQTVIRLKIVINNFIYLMNNKKNYKKQHLYILRLKTKKMKLNQLKSLKGKLNIYKILKT